MRLARTAYAQAFADAAPLFTQTQALMESERCLYCYAAPCVTACPTGIDVPAFIHRIADGNLRGAARTILDANPLGGTCARVCPTEELCEQACVRMTQQGTPVSIGRLQRYAVDGYLQQSGAPLFVRAAETGKRIAVVGAGPAGLACAHVLARAGHRVQIFDAGAKPGGLNEYGLATYKMTGDYAQREIRWLLELGGIEITHDWALASAADLEPLRTEYDAVFLGVGLAGVHTLGIPGEELAGVRDAVEFIAQLRQASDPATLPIGRRVVVIGGGMTAIDAAVQAKLLGAESVAIVYRRSLESMPASDAERRWAQTHDIVFLPWLAPVELIGDAGRLVAVRCERQAMRAERLAATGEFEVLAADMIFKAIGQRLGTGLLAATGIVEKGGRILIDDDGRTSLPDVWAGGDCRFGGRDLTVTAVEDGKRAANSINHYLATARVAPATPEAAT